MARGCTICIHPASATINEALETDRSLRDIAAEFGVSKTALPRHWHAHILSAHSLTVEDAKTSVKTKPIRRGFAVVKWLVVIAGLAIGVVTWASLFRDGEQLVVSRPP